MLPSLTPRSLWFPEFSVASLLRLRVDKSTSALATPVQKIYCSIQYSAHVLVFPARKKFARGLLLHVNMEFVEKEEIY